MRINSFLRWLTMDLQLWPLQKSRDKHNVCEINNFFTNESDISDIIYCYISNTLIMLGCDFNYNISSERVTLKHLTHYFRTANY
jgi:hypothetical protein